MSSGLLGFYCTGSVFHVRGFRTTMTTMSIFTVRDATDGVTKANMAVAKA